jgi:hypothetical protein
MKRNKMTLESKSMTILKSRLTKERSGCQKASRRFHENLGHAGSTRTVNSISQTFDFLLSRERLKKSSGHVIRVRDTSDPTRNFTGNSLWYQRYTTKSLGNASMWIASVPSKFKSKMQTRGLTFWRSTV